MKGFVIASVAFASLIGTSALAADMAVKAPMAAPAAFSWTGFYIGGNAGYTWGKTEALDELATNGAFWFINDGNWTANTRGFTGGGQFGYNLQNGLFVYGLEADLGYLGLRGKGFYPISGNTTFVSTDGGFYTTIRGRLGIAPTSGLLLYITGGYFGADFHSTVQTTPAAGVQLLNPGASGFQSGWTVGTGAEWAFAPHWSIKGEYLHFEVPKKNVGDNFAGGGATIQYFGVTNIGNLVRAGLNYHF